ncbi:MAG: hypothetical protein ACETVX_06740 [bacterium]
MNRVNYRSKNRYNEFLSAAKTIAKKIAKIDGVIGILAIGGIGRGHCDDYSDLDLIIYADDTKVKELRKYIAKGGLRYKEIDLDTPVESYQKALNHKSPSRYWSQIMRWDRENSQILFDANNKIKNLLKAKLVFPDWEQQRLLRRCRHEVENSLKWNFELWQKRGDLINLADSLIRATEYIIRWIYAKNKKFKPYIPKWLFYYLENNLVPESKYFKIIKKPYLEPIKTIEQAIKIRNALLKLCEKIGIELRTGNIEAVFFARHKNNWHKASEKTKYYLSW